jgi:N-acetylneuraminic acid mutarotase
MAVTLLLVTACAPTTLEVTTIPPTATQEPTPTTEPTPTATLPPTEVVILQPSTRIYVSFAFDSESNQVILFGGQITAASPYTAIGDTWAYDVTASKWTLMNPSSSPSPMGAASMAYDSESDRVIIFGGASGGNMKAWGVSDTWAYDYNTNTWTKMSNGPQKHLGGRIVYDAESDRIILFGGLNPISFEYYNDTWAYDYNSDTWIEMKPLLSPPGRNFQSITYDTKADRVLTWGGFDNEYKPVDESVWSYDFNANTWQELSPGEAPHPACRDYSVMAYDDESDRSILFGGVGIGKATGIWAFDHNTNTWLEMSATNDPGKVAKHHLEYISSIDRVFLFGGEYCDKFCNLSNETWLYDYNTNTWENVSSLP